MRDKFTELIEKGVTQRTYVPIAKEIPDLDLFSRMYNNIFGIATDTHMSNISGTGIMGDDVRVITGHMINTPEWDKFISYPNWCHINFYNSCGAWCLADFLFKNGYHGAKGTLNSDTVYFVKPIPPQPEVPAEYGSVQSFTTSESKIPHPLVELTTNGDIIKLKECLNSSDVIKNLNESLYIKGNNWIISEGKIIGLIGNTVIYLNK